MSETLANIIRLGVAEIYEVWLVGHPDKDSYGDRCIWRGTELDAAEGLREEWDGGLYDVIVIRAALTRTIIGGAQKKEPKS